MNLSNINFTAYREKLRSLLKSSTRKRELFAPRPVRDWFIALVVAVCITLAFGAYSTYLFIEVSTGRGIQIEAGASDDSSRLSREELREAIEFLEARAQAYENLRNNPPRQLDPSL